MELGEHEEGAVLAVSVPPISQLLTVSVDPSVYSRLVYPQKTYPMEYLE